MPEKVKWGFNNFARVIAERNMAEEEGGMEKDTFIIIYGIRRSGKTTLGLHILSNYLKVVRKLHKQGRIDWKPPKRWTPLFKNHFSGDAEDMKERLKDLPKRSFVFIDEAVDVVSWMNMMKQEQKNLIQLIQKTGEKGLLTILVTPSLSLLTKNILKDAHYLFIVPDEPGPKGNDAFILRNHTNPFLAEERPFGLTKIKNDLKKNPMIAEDKNSFLSYIQSSKRFIGAIRYHSFRKEVYDLYKKLVKEPQMFKLEKKKKSVSREKWEKLKYAFDTVLYRLYNNEDMSIAQINRLLTDKFGNSLKSKSSIRRYVNRINSMEHEPDFDDVDDAIKQNVQEEIDISEEEDVEIEGTEED